jgi:peptide-methionine (S)-S-oxide reductase
VAGEAIGENNLPWAEPIDAGRGYSYIVMIIKVVLPALFAVLAVALYSSAGREGNGPESGGADSTKIPDGMELATFGAGCFWCVEAVFENVKGVGSVVSGYAGGKRPNPTYEQVSTGATGHAEACQIAFDPKVVSYAELLEIFWKTHDPTTEDRQGNDAGPQYRSVIFYHSEEQRKAAEFYRKKLEEEKVYDAPIVTEIVPFEAFWKGEAYHQNYFTNNPDQPYCRFVIQPKVEKFRKAFSHKLKTN